MRTLSKSNGLAVRRGDTPLTPDGDTALAIFHVDIRAVQRSAGRSATAAAAYVLGARILDERTGQIHNYTRRHGVEAVGQVGWHRDAAELWNAAEKAEKHPRGITARTSIIALPAELDGQDRIACLEEIAAQIRNRWSVAVTWAAHAPSEDGDERNHHGHVQWTSRAVTDDGLFGAKTRELDVRPSSSTEITWFRSMVAEVINGHLAEQGLDDRIDHRSLQARWLAGEISEAETLRARHLGPAASAIERRGIDTDTGDHNRRVAEIRVVARQLRAVETQLDREAKDPLNQALASAPSSRTSNEYATNRLTSGRFQVAAAAAELDRPSPGFEPLTTALAGPARPGRSNNRLGTGRARVAAAARNIREDRREGNDGSAGARGDLERAQPSTSGRAEPSRTALRPPRRPGSSDRAAPESVCRTDRPAPASHQTEHRRRVRTPASAQAAAVILARDKERSPSSSAYGTSKAGPATPDQVRLARNALADKALKRLKERLKKWVLRAFAVVARRAPEPHKIPDGLARAAYETGLRVGASNRALLDDGEVEARAAARIARDLADTKQSAAVVRRPVVNQDRERD